MVVYIFVNRSANGGGGKKRSLVEGRGIEFANNDVPVAQIYGQSKIVVMPRRTPGAPSLQPRGAVGPRFIRVGEGFRPDTAPDSTIEKEKRYVINTDFNNPDSSDDEDAASSLKLERRYVKIGEDFQPDPNAGRRFIVPGRPWEGDAESE